MWLRISDLGKRRRPELMSLLCSRADRSLRAPEATAFAPGLGLGLSIAAEVVAKHGGTISACPADGDGTQVTVRLPLLDNATAECTTTADMLQA